MRQVPLARSVVGRWPPGRREGSNLAQRAEKAVRQGEVASSLADAVLKGCEVRVEAWARARARMHVVTDSGAGRDEMHSVGRCSGREETRAVHVCGTGGDESQCMCAVQEDVYSTYYAETHT